MNWLERYIFAVKAHLPASLREDVGAELLADLEDELEHRREQLGRELTETEVKSLLQERGHPLLVAANFQPRRTLVSEELFPLYSLIMKWLLIGVIVVHGVSWLSQLAVHADPNFIRSGLQTAWGMFNSALYCFAWLTLIFYVIGESADRTQLFQNWHPESLPKVSAGAEPISRVGTVIELVFTGFMLIWLNRQIPSGAGAPPLQLLFSEAWLGLLPWINVTLVGVLALGFAKLLFPYWNRSKLVLEALLLLPAIALVLIIASWEAPLTLQLGAEAAQVPVPETWIDYGVGGYLIAILVDSLLKVRLWRRL